MSISRFSTFHNRPAADASEPKELRRATTSGHHLGYISESDSSDTTIRKFRKKKSASKHFQEKLEQELEPAFIKLVETNIKKYEAEFLPMTDNRETCLKEREHFRNEMERFTRQTSVKRYMISPKGKEATLEGTPRGGLSKETETNKTLGSYAIVVLAKMGKPVFGTDSEGISKRDDLKAMVNAGNDLCGDPDGMMHVFSIHDLFKSKANVTLVVDRLNYLMGSDQAKIHQPAKLLRGGAHSSPVTTQMNAEKGQASSLPVSEVSGLPVDGQTFKQMDHDSRLSIAMKLVKQEIDSGQAGNANSVTRMLFPEASGLSFEGIKRIAGTVEEMWDLHANILQLNQGEIEPAQLEKLVEKIKSCKTDAEFDRVLRLLNALTGHELTDLAGAANPFVSVLGASVTGGYLSTAHKLRDSVIGLRKKILDGNVDDVKAEARLLYKDALPSIDKETAAYARKRLGNDGFCPEFLVRRLAQATRNKSLTGEDAKKAEKIIDDLCKVKDSSPEAWKHLTQQLGREENRLYAYYLPELFVILQAELKNTDGIEVNAYTTAGYALKHMHETIEKLGGEEKYIKQNGVQFVDLRKVCMGIQIEILTARSEMKKFDPSTILFTGSKSMDVKESELSLATNLSKVLNLEQLVNNHHRKDIEKTNMATKQLMMELKDAVNALPRNVALLLNKELTRQIKEDEKGVVLGDLTKLAKAINKAGVTDEIADWSGETLKVLLFTMAQLYLQGRTRLREGEAGPYLIDLGNIIAAAENSIGFKKLQDGKFQVTNRRAEIKNRTELSGSKLERLESLASLPGKNPMIVTCGGSSSLSGAAVGQLLESAGKTVCGLVSVRSSTGRPLGGDESPDGKRQLPDDAIDAKLAVFAMARISPDLHMDDADKGDGVSGVNKANGRFAEKVAASHYDTLLVLDKGREAMLQQLRVAMGEMGPPPDNIVFVSPGGAVTFPETRKSERVVQNLSDFNLMHALTELRSDSPELPISLLSINSGIDAPHDMVEIMKQGQWKFMNFDDDAKIKLKNFDAGLSLPENDNDLFSRNRSVMQKALDGEYGLQALNAPASKVLDDRNGWDFIVNVTPGMNGIAYSSLDQHNAGLAEFASGTASSEAPIRQE